MILWIAGWPHNGSTICRQILKDAFDIQTFSKYQEAELDDMFKGSVEFQRKWAKDPSLRHKYLLEHNDTTVIKTHELPLDNAPTIFVVRDGRDSVCALSNFWQIPINMAITGSGCPFGTWSAYYHGWNPEERPNTLVLRFEDMVKNPNDEAKKIAEFIGQKQVRPYVDDFEEKKKEFPYLFKDRTGIWQKRMSKENLELFDKCHGTLNRELCYE